MLINIFMLRSQLYCIYRNFVLSKRGTDIYKKLNIFHVDLDYFTFYLLRRMGV